MCLTILERFNANYSGIKLNYLTLTISDPIARKDFQTHKIEVQNRRALFWCCCVLNIIHILLQTLNFIKNTENVQGLTAAAICFLFGNIFWPIFIKCRPHWTPYLFAVFYLAVAVSTVALTFASI